MRGPEPFAGYDALDMDAVLESVVEIQHRLQAAQPAAVVPAYQSLGGASV